MKILVVGSGAREHALCLGLSRDPSVSSLVCAPGNGGTVALADSRPLAVEDAGAIASLAESVDADLTVIGPEGPLVAGAADELRRRGRLAFGPSAAAAALEGSKSFAKQVMAAAGVPTARYRECTSPAEVRAALDAFAPPYVVKYDGLAAGKGVAVTDSAAEALAHAARSERVVVEEYLGGPEVSLLAVTDGRTVLPLAPAQDFKRVGDGDTGPNTGGMGAYSPLPWAADDLVDVVLRTVLQPTVDEMARRGTPFAGVLYAGLAITPDGPRVIEFNARFGDPETQVLLPRLRTPLAGVLRAAAQGDLGGVALDWSPDAAVTVMVAAPGYPGAVTTGGVIQGLAEASAVPGVSVLHAGTQRVGDQLVTSGGRVLSVTASAATLAAARAAAYEAVRRISFPGMHYRHDIAERAAAG